MLSVYEAHYSKISHYLSGKVNQLADNKGPTVAEPTEVVYDTMAATEVLKFLNAQAQLSYNYQSARFRSLVSKDNPYLCVLQTLIKLPDQGSKETNNWTYQFYNHLLGTKMGYTSCGRCLRTLPPKKGRNVKIKHVQMCD